MHICVRKLATDWATMAQNSHVVVMMDAIMIIKLHVVLVMTRRTTGDTNNLVLFSVEVVSVGIVVQVFQEGVTINTTIWILNNQCWSRMLQFYVVNSTNIK